MITPSLIYLINLADNIQGLFIGIGLIFGGIGVCWLLSTNSSFEETVITKKNIIIFALSILFFIGATFIPSTKTCYEMLIIPKIANAQVTQKLPLYLQEYIEKELKGADK